MTKKSKKHGKSVFFRGSIKGTDIGKSTYDVGTPTFHILSQKDIENELSQIEKKFGMTAEEFHKAWKKGRVHGHEAMKLGSYYEFYKDEYE